MILKIVGKNVDVWDKTKETVEKKMGRIEKLFPEDAKATITLSVEKRTSTVEATIVLTKRVVRAEVSEDDLIVAMDKVVDILERQMVRYKKRLRTKMRNEAVDMAIYQAEYDANGVSETDMDRDDEDSKIQRVKHFELKPMDVEEAIMEMELVGHNFFVFRNDESEAVNVVYKRKDGTYGLIDPE
ncbi:MAG: ribosome-associated translation inhibitor RaiA [Bacillota bacterium]